jgi:hypothetical protein
MERTVVVFRVFKKGRDLIALFPFEDWADDGSCSSYQKIGQHGAADYKYCISASRPATPDEYRSLKRELENIGYCLEVRPRKFGREK